MAKSPVLSDITNIYTSAATINANSRRIEDSFQNTLSRDGSTPNQMEADLDMNSNDVLNVKDLSINGNFYYDGELVGPADFFSDEVQGYVDQAQGFAEDAAESAQDAQEAADIAVGAVGAVLSFADIAELQADTRDLPLGAVVNTRKGGYAFEIVSSDPDMTTAGGKFLRALPDSEGFVCVDQYGAKGDGNRLLPFSGTNNTDAFRKAFASPYNVKFGYGTYVIRDTVQNLKENRVIKGCGMGMCTSSPRGDRLYFNAPTSLLAISGGGLPTRRVITRRKYRASASDPNDDPISAVIENWGAGSVFKDFSIELYCDYTDMGQSNWGANWDVGFFNGCRSDVGCVDVSIMGYFRKANFYWDVTDAYGIPNLLDIYGNPVPIPTLGNDSGPEYGRGSGADGCYMYRCQARGRVGRVILGADTSRTGAPYYDWVSNATYADVRGQSGSSDFRSRDCVMRAEHHSLVRQKDPVNYGSTLTYNSMMQEPDNAPCAQYIDVWQPGTSGGGAPWDSARGMVFDDLRYVSREIFRTRLGQIQQIFFGPRTWSESNGAPDQFFDRQGNDIYAIRGDEVNQIYGHLCTNQYTGLVKWDNHIGGTFSRWIYDWRYTRITDLQGRARGVSSGWFEIPAGSKYDLQLNHLRPGGYMSFMAGGIGTNVPLVGGSCRLWFDVASTPLLQAAGHVGGNVTLLAPGVEPTTANTPNGNIGISAFQGGFLRVFNRLAAGTVTIAWSVD